MNNINTQVSPRNGVDFSKIRKAQEGMRILKFQNPSGPIYDFDTFLNNLPTNKFKRGQTKSSIPWTPNWEGISGKYANVGELEANDKYKAFTDYVIQKAQGENSDPRVLEYLKLLEQTTIDPNHKSILFDTNGNLNQNWADEYRRLRNDGKYGYYHLGPEGDPETPPRIPPVVSPPLETPPGEPSNPGDYTPEEPSIPGDYTPDEYHNFKFKPEPFLTPNPFIAGLGLAANKHAYDNEMQKKVPLLEAPYHQYITGAYKTTVDAYNKAGTDIQSAANRIANQSSNLEQNQAIQLEGAVKAADKRLEGALKQQEGYNFDRGKSLETAYFNSDADNRTATNINRQNLVADWNRKMDAKSKYQWTRNNIKSDFINKTWTDFQQWSANEKNERDSALASYNDYIANLGIQNAMKPYTDLASDPMKSKSFNTVYQNAFNDFNSNLSNNSWLTSNKSLVDIFANDELDQKAKNDAFMNYLRTSNSDYTTQFNQGYNSELTEAKNKAITDRQSIQNELASIQPSFRNTYIGGWGPWDTRRLGKKLTLFSKDGGILKMKHGSRFVDYLEHNRKAIKDQKQTTIEISKQMERQLKEQLQALDRETLILLRSIFK